MSLILRNRPTLSPFWLDSWMERPATTVRHAQPAINVKETETGFGLEIAAPGVSKEDFNLKVEGNRLTIEVSRKEENEESSDRYTRREFSEYAFKRVFQLPESVDVEGIKASHENGILLVDLPKKEAAVPNSLEIEVA